MKSYFDQEFFTSNRQKLRRLFTGTAPIVITANGLLQRRSDNTFAFVQDANFWYLTGIDEPDIILVMDKDKEYLIVPSRSSSRETFDGAIDEAGLIRRSGIQVVYDEKAGWEKLGARLKKVKHVATLASPGPYVDFFGFYVNPARDALNARLKSFKSELELLDLNPHLIKLRTVKQPQELYAIQSAIDITIAAIKDATRPAKLNGYAYEYEVEAEITRGMRRRGASGHSFEPIVAAGERACTMHNVSNNGELTKGDLVLIDTGAEVENYAADISRTFSLKPVPSKRQRAIHEAVVEVQKYGFGLLKPGILIKDYEQAIEHFMGEKLRELGLIKTITHENVRQYYPHATSHFMGLNVHDVGDYDHVLEVGSVLTVEPGIYVKEESIGVRIEDDVLITPKGIKILSGKLSRELV